MSRLSENYNLAVSMGFRSLFLCFCLGLGVSAKIPVVINTWPFTDATNAAWESLMKTDSLLDAVEAGCSKCEENQCGKDVETGGSKKM